MATTKPVAPSPEPPPAPVEVPAGSSIPGVPAPSDKQ